MSNERGGEKAGERRAFMGKPLPYLDVEDLGGKLIVIEGTDGVGRSTQIASLQKWLEVRGHGVVTTGWTRSPLMAKAINDAKAGHRLNVHTFSLFYAADFADRLEHEILPAMRAGFVVLADRYVYTVFARAAVRGADPAWVRKVFSFAPVPDAVFYMKIDVENLIPRVIHPQQLRSRRLLEEGGSAAWGMDYWESGMDLRLGDDFYDSFVEYQRRLLAEFSGMSKEFGFLSVNAVRSFEDTNRRLKEGIASVLS